MKIRPHDCSLVLVLFLASLSGLPAEAQSFSLANLMPRASDYTRMWWQDGFPGTVKGAPWHRCVQTGQYGFVLDTERLMIPRLGALVSGESYEGSARNDALLPGKLKPADLALSIAVGGKRYQYAGGGQWSRFGGPRLIESGRFLQRADVTNLVFAADDGARLNVEARFETAAWADRLALILAARPGTLPIPAGMTCFGRVRGGFGLDGINEFEIPHAPEMDSKEFTLEFWAFVPEDYRVTRTSPWLVCRGPHEHADGNFGLYIRGDRVPQARLNIGGGSENAFVAEGTSRDALRLERWNHLAVAYDGSVLQLYVNGRLAAEQNVNRVRAPVSTPARGSMVFGRRGDNSGDGYRFRGVIDEVRLYDRALKLEELRWHYGRPEIERPALKPVAEWTFREDGKASMTKPREQWRDASMEIRLSTEAGTLSNRWEPSADETASGQDWQTVSLAIDHATFKLAETPDLVTVSASEIPSGAARPVEYDSAVGWYRVNLDEIKPLNPDEVEGASNDAIERVKLVLSNSSGQEQRVRLMFEKTSRGIHQRIGTPITGVSAVLRDAEGHPTGIPVQLSKNWHNSAEGGEYSGQWFHGISQVRLPRTSSIELELTLAYGHWGGVAAASHAQLSLIGWGGSQLWDQSAMGAWGESICFNPEQTQANCTITDVRPLMVRPMGREEPWGWTSNVGGGDFFRLFGSSGERVPHGAMRATYLRQGPCLTEVTYAGRVGDGIRQSTTVSLSRGDDVVRGTYRIRMDVKKETEFSRFVVFQIGADTYSSTGEKKIAVGNESGLLREWSTRWGGNVYRTEPMECSGRIPWVSLHEAVPRQNEKPGAWANRGLVIRAWNARLGGQDAAPWIAERGLDRRPVNSSTLDIVPPPGVSRLESGDFVEATIEHIVMPQFAKDYYGPNEALKSALLQDGNTWRMIHREAVGNDRQVEASLGNVLATHPAVYVQTNDDSAQIRLSGGLGYVPVTFAGLSTSREFELLIDGERFDQSVHGNDFWQTDWDAATQTWSQTYNIPCNGNRSSVLEFGQRP